ncbi:hypothetical protein N0824_02862 [Microcystis sp. 0824]|nr:hypothetical protein N0824_02862 [Microcystis sp. 0824]
MNFPETIKAKINQGEKLVNHFSSPLIFPYFFVNIYGSKAI